MKIYNVRELTEKANKIMELLHGEGLNGMCKIKKYNVEWSPEKNNIEILLTYLDYNVRIVYTMEVDVLEDDGYYKRCNKHIWIKNEYGEYLSNINTRLNSLEELIEHIEIHGVQ